MGQLLSCDTLALPIEVIVEKQPIFGLPLRAKV